MSGPERDKILDHDYDGIKELDNPLPGWWLFIFHASTVWAIGYALWFHAGPGVASRQQRIAAIDEALAAKRAAAAAPQDYSAAEPQLQALARDAVALASGKEIFAMRCMPCHGMAGEGLVGPNLTDDHVIHGWRLSDIYHVVNEGVPEKGMIPWKSMLTELQMMEVSAYIATLRGTNPPNPKAPEGELASGNPLP